MHIFYNQTVITARAYCLLKLNPNHIIIHNSKKTCVGVKVHQYNFRSDDGLVDDPKLVYVNCRCRWCFSDIAIWPNLRLALSICRHKMMTKWPHTMWKRTTLCCILHTLVLEVNNFHLHCNVWMKIIHFQNQRMQFNMALFVFMFCVAIASSYYVYRLLEPITGLVKWGRYLLGLILHIYIVLFLSPNAHVWMASFECFNDL